MQNSLEAGSRPKEKGPREEYVAAGQEFCFGVIGYSISM
jgi:hypothetical protein